MKESLIKWKKEDISNLRKAVNEFNRRISELESFGREVVPKRLNYKDVKAEIFTRQELNRRINEMKRLNKASMVQLVMLDSGDLITRYELKQIESAKKRAERRLTSELAGLEATTSGLGNKRINEIKATLKSFEKLNKLSKSDFKRVQKRIMQEGLRDFEIKRAKQFQDNFIKAYRKMGRKEIVKFAKSFKNPMDFWNVIKDSRFTDIQERYDNEAGLISFGASADDIYYAELDSLGISY